MGKGLPKPKGMATISAYIIVKDAEKAQDFYAKAFGMKKGLVMKSPDGSMVVHCELHSGDSTLMMSQENPDWGVKSAETLGGSPATLHLYVDDVDETYKAAVEAGCTSAQEPMDMFWGDRMAKLKDPFGFEWGLATRMEELTEEEVARRGQEFMEKMAASGEPC